MGYLTHVTGEITLDPPLPWKVIKDSLFLNRQPNGYPERDVRFDLAVEQVETDDGLLTRRTAVAIVPAYEDGFRAYNIEDHLAELVADLPLGTKVGGYLQGEGEKSGDLWRLYVLPDGDRLRVVKVTVQLVWPDPA